jgi:hypothetical protein
MCSRAGRALAALLAATTAAGVLTAPSAGAITPAETRFERLVDAAGPGATSVAILDETTHKLLARGAGSGMVCASIVKVLILEETLLIAQRQGRGLTPSERNLATAMIEHSDNNAADALYREIGTPRFARLAGNLGLSSRTVPNPAGMWGLTTTNARDQLTLLGNLTNDDSPLTLGRRDFALSLMRHVEADQRWGVPVAADPGSLSAVKNGWLAVDDDRGRWAINSVGIIRVDGHRVLEAVLTQHGSGYTTGIRRVEELALAAADALEASS